MSNTDKNLTGYILFCAC